MVWLHFSHVGIHGKICVHHVSRARQSLLYPIHEDNGQMRMVIPCHLSRLSLTSWRLYLGPMRSSAGLFVLLQPAIWCRPPFRSNSTLPPRPRLLVTHVILGLFAIVSHIHTSCRAVSAGHYQIYHLEVFDLSSRCDQMLTTASHHVLR